ncbi:MAG: hypothetical protein ABEN55_09515 [Bradymonadaceae bacterium]
MARPVDDEIPYHLQEAILADPALSHLEVFLGWVRNTEFEVPSISIVPGDVDRTDTHGIERIDPVDTDTVAVFFRDTTVTLPLTLELYTTDKTERSKLTEPIRKLFHPDPPDKTSDPPGRHLELTLDKHHGAEAFLYLRNSEPSDSEGVSEGYFRRTFNVVAETVELTRHEYERATITSNTNIEG